MSDSLQPHGLEHARLLCPPLSPRVFSVSWPLSQWCYLTIVSSTIAFFFGPHDETWPAPEHPRPWLSGQESTGDAGDTGRHGFSAWTEKIPWRRKWQPTPVFLSGKAMDRGAWRLQATGLQRDTTEPSTARPLRVLRSETTDAPGVWRPFQLRQSRAVCLRELWDTKKKHWSFQTFHLGLITRDFPLIKAFKN